MPVLNDLKTLLAETLYLGDRVRAMTADTRLMGDLPELDSMAVVEVVSAMEQRFRIVVDDEDITAELFATLGSLSQYVERKLAS